MSVRSRVLTYGLPAIGAAALMGGGVLVTTNRPVYADEVPPRAPTTAPDPDTAYIGATGLTEPPGEAVTIAAHLAGVVSSVPIEVGDRVSAGDVLFELDPRAAERRVAVERAAVGVAESELAATLALVGPAQATAASAAAAVGSASAAVGSAEAELADRHNRQRVAEAVDDPRAIPAEEVASRRFATTRAEAALRSAAAQRVQAEAGREEAVARLGLLVDPQTGDDGADVTAARQRVAQARARLAQAQTDRELLIARAPTDGEVIQVNTRAGQFAPAAVMTDDPLVVMARPGPVHLRVQIDEVDLPRFRRDAPATASPRGDTSRRLALTLAYVEPFVVPKRSLSGRTAELIDTRVLEVVYVVAPDGGGPLSFGQQLDVYIEAEKADPSAAGGAS